MVERVVAEVNVVVAGTALILAALAGVAGVVLGAGIRNFHHDASSIASTEAAAIVLALNLQALAAHISWAARALALAQVGIPAVIAVTSLALGVRTAAAALIALPELGAIGGCSTVTAFSAADSCATLSRRVVSCSGLVNGCVNSQDETSSKCSQHNLI